MKLKGKRVIVATHTRPDEDVIISVALLRHAGVNIIDYWFRKEGDESLPPQLQFENILWVDRGRRVFDHHGIKGETSASMVAKELGIEKKWLQPILNHVKRADLEGRSEPMDINHILKAISREINNDEEIMKIGLEIASALICFHEKSLLRDNAFVATIISDYFAEKEMPERIKRYCQLLLLHSKFQRSCDFVEILCGKRELENENNAREFGKMILNYIVKDIERYKEAEEEVRAAKKIVVSLPYRWLIVAGESDNAKFNVAARELGAAVVIQRNKDGHVQIYFNNKILSPQMIAAISEDLIEIIRMREISLGSNQKIPIKSTLRNPGKITEVPEWYLFAGEKGGRLILNGSLTAPDIPVTKINFDEIVGFACEVLKHYANHLGHGAARGGSPLVNRVRGNAVRIKRKRKTAPKIVP